jgi:hypothetical protein
VLRAQVDVSEQLTQNFQDKLAKLLEEAGQDEEDSALTTVE